jgi:hypothetical protein
LIEENRGIEGYLIILRYFGVANLDFWNTISSFSEFGLEGGVMEYRQQLLLPFC